MSIDQIQSLIEKISTCDWRRVKSDITELCKKELKDILWEESFLEIVSTKTGTKKALLQALEKELTREIGTEILNPQRDRQQAAITRQEINKVERLPLNAKLHLLQQNSLLNNIQLAFADPVDYIEFDVDKFVWMNPNQIQDEIRRAIRNYIVINPLKAKALYKKLWLPLALNNTEDLKKILADAKIHQYTTSNKIASFREKTTPRITYIQGFPMLFGKNLVHVPYGDDATRAEKSKYDIDTSAKIFDDFYSLIRAHSHIQDSEQEGIQFLTELNTLLVEANNIINDKNSRDTLVALIEEIITKLDPKKDSKINKAKTQDLQYILQNSHTVRNSKKLQAAIEKIKQRITAQHEIKHTVWQQQQALYEDLAQQEMQTRNYFREIESHLNDFNIKKRSARQIAIQYQPLLYAKPFYDLHDHLIQLDDQAKLNKWMPYIYKEKVEIDTIMQKWYITLLRMKNFMKSSKTIPVQARFQDMRNAMITPSIAEKNYYFDFCIKSIDELIHNPNDAELIDTIIAQAHGHMQSRRKSLLEG